MRGNWLGSNRILWRKVNFIYHQNHRAIAYGFINLRVFLNPENLIWSLNYQNSFVYGFLGLDLQNVNLREAQICLNLAFFGNDFCGRDIN